MLRAIKVYFFYLSFCFYLGWPVAVPRKRATQGTVTLAFSSTESVGAIDWQKRGMNAMENHLTAWAFSIRDATMKMKTNVLDVELKTTCTR